MAIAIYSKPNQGSEIGRAYIQTAIETDIEIEAAESIV